MTEARALLLPTEAAVRVAVAPPAPLLSPLQRALQEHVDQANKPLLQLAVQDISSFPPGSYTGAIAARNLEGFSVEYAIVGHSERREYFHETHQDVANKVAQCLEHDITPIICVDDEYIREQAVAIPAPQRAKSLVAFEERSAIGSGDPVDLQEVAEVIAQIREQFAPLGVLYGGSVDVSNVVDYIGISDGVLVGGASLDGKQFARLVQAGI